MRRPAERPCLRDRAAALALPTRAAPVSCLSPGRRPLGFPAAGFVGLPPTAHSAHPRFVPCIDSAQASQRWVREERLAIGVTVPSRSLNRQIAEPKQPRTGVGIPSGSKFRSGVFSSEPPRFGQSSNGGTFFACRARSEVVLLQGCGVERKSHFVDDTFSRMPSLQECHTIGPLSFHPIGPRY
jgi:hypothetical protein